MTQQSQQLWSVIENILLIINILWRQQHGRAVKRGYWSNWVFGKLDGTLIVTPKWSRLLLLESKL